MVSPGDDLSFVINRPVELKLHSATVELGGQDWKTLVYLFQRHSLVLSKTENLFLMVATTVAVCFLYSNQAHTTLTVLPHMKKALQNYSTCSNQQKSNERRLLIKLFENCPQLAACAPLHNSLSLSFVRSTVLDAAEKDM